MLGMQLIDIMNKLWLREGLDLKMITYKCMATGPDVGMIEVVREAETLGQIHTEYGITGIKQKWKFIFVSSLFYFHLIYFCDSCLFVYMRSPVR